MFFPIRTDVPLRNTPWINWLLILLNVVVFSLQNSMGLQGKLALDPRQLSLVNYITYAFVHGSIMHLASNMLFLYIFGNNLNDRLGHVGYLAFYLAGAVVAGVVHVLVESSAVIGASGAVFAVTGGFLILFPRARVTIVYFLIFIGVVELASMWFILAYFLLNVASQFSQFMGAESGVAYAAHLGGSIFGASICLLLLALKLLPRNQWDMLALIDRWNRRRQYRGVVASGYDPFAYLPRKGSAPDPRADRIQELRAEVAEAMAHSKIFDAVKLYMELRAIGPTQVLGRQNQLDIANHLYEQEHYAAAADAYEGIVRAYPKSDQIVHVMLMLGLLNARYLNRADKAEPYLRQVIERMHEGREVDLARAELARMTSPSDR